jgi:hypothetical protein
VQSPAENDNAKFDTTIDVGVKIARNSVLLTVAHDVLRFHLTVGGPDRDCRSPRINEIVRRIGLDGNRLGLWLAISTLAGRQVSESNSGAPPIGESSLVRPDLAHFVSA